MIILTGDLNLMGVTDPDVPFRRVKSEFLAADLVFGNLECCLYDPPPGYTADDEGFHVAVATGGEALHRAGIGAVGLANNVNYGEAAIRSSIARLDELGIMHTGAGDSLAAARAPAIIERNGVRIGFLQRTSVYWPTHHEARDNATGVAVIQGNTAWQLPMHNWQPETPPLNRPGLPPQVITWAEPRYLASIQEDIAALRSKVNIVVASCHWGLWEDVLEYMTEIAHAAIDAGADIVVGHGPHYALPVEIYKGKPVFYGLGCFSFNTGHGGTRFGDWVGMMARVWVDTGAIVRSSFQFVRHNQDNETLLCSLAAEQATLQSIEKKSAIYGTVFTSEGDQVFVTSRN
ncbi:MAG: CapA family protein [Betaproteobacteria bacterium]|nr:CapA family protein [Betaproteobacteria bacterium]